jgi:prepilin-type N-terminal cleavage/methylation domain-containing protein
MKKLKSRSSGFTLIEMAMVLLIVGLLLSGSLNLLSAQVEVQQRRATQKILEDTKEALIGFAIINGRLPKPASSPTIGTEKSAACTGNNPDIVCTGFIPWTVLGTEKLDAWGKIIRYSVAPKLTTSNSIKTNTEGTKIVQGSPLVGGVRNVLIEKADAVIFSNGKRNYGTTDFGLILPNEAKIPNYSEWINEINNHGRLFIAKEVFMASVKYSGFDDMVIWLSPETLNSRMAQAGVLVASAPKVP